MPQMRTLGLQRECHGAVSDETCFLAEQQGRRGEQEMDVLEFDPAGK